MKRLRSAILAKSDLLHATMPDGTKYGEDTDLRKFTYPDNWGTEQREAIFEANVLEPGVNQGEI